jgi:hypothetical protein
LRESGAPSSSTASAIARSYRGRAFATLPAIRRVL